MRFYTLEERSCAVRKTQGMKVLCEFVDHNELINLPIFEARFTWSNFQERPSMSKLDMFFISVKWDDYLTSVSVHALPRLGLDHTSI